MALSAGRVVQRCLTVKCLLLALAVMMACPLQAQQSGSSHAAPEYQFVPPTPDAIGKVYMGRPIARVMGWEGAQWLERPERTQEERTDRLIPLLGLLPGMTVADIGAGTGFITRLIAKQVGTKGMVFGVDIQPQMLALLRKAADADQLHNIRTVQSNNKSVVLPANSIDVAVMVDVYHELEYPFETLGSIVRSLKPGGRVVFVEYRANDPDVPIKPVHTMSEYQIRREAEAAGLQWVSTDRSLPWQFVVMFKK